MTETIEAHAERAREGRPLKGGDPNELFCIIFIIRVRSPWSPEAVWSWRLDRVRQLV